MPAGTQVRGTKYDYKVVEILDGFAIPESLDYDPDRSGYLRINGEDVEKYILGTGWLPIAGANNYPTSLVYDLGQLTLGRNGLSDLSVTIDKDALGLGLVENIALSTWTGSDNITNVGVITDGVWNGMAISPLKGGIPPGGTVGQVIKKLSSTDYDVDWADEDGVGGGSSAWGGITGTLSDQIDLITALNGKQPSDTDLTAIAGLTPSNDDIIQRKAGAWTNRTLAQYKVDLAINNVDNTSDINKPVSTAQAAAIALKQDLLISGTNIKTINGSSILGSGNITISGGTTYTFSDGVVESSGAVSIPTNGITSAKINAGAVNDSKISDVAWAKITGTPTTVAGYGISDAVTLTGTQTITNKTISGANNTLSNLALTALVQGGAALNQVLRWNGSVWAPSDESSGGTSYIFTPADFNNLAGTISIDYVNGQAASASTKGFLTSSDWLAFNGKQNQITTGSTAQYFRGDLSLATFPTNISTFVNDSGYLVNITGKISAGTNIIITGLGTTASPYVITSTASGLTDGDKGDITVSASGSSWVVDALAITNAKINDVAWSKITSTPTTVSGYGITDAVTLTGTQTLTNKTLTSPKINVGADATGDVYFRDGSGNLVRLGIGSTGQVLKVVSGLPAWAADATGGGGGATLTDGDYGDVTVSATGTAIFIDNGVVSNAKLANVATATIKGRVTASTGVVEDLTGTQATTLLDVFTSTLKGLVPLSGGGTTNFLRADGTWAAPSGGTSYTFTASDFNESGTTISIDYSNGQAASTSLKGFLTATDWNTFNSKQNAITTGSTSQYFRGDLSLATFPTNVSTFTNDAAYLQNITGKLTAGTNVSITGSGTTGSPYVINASASGTVTGVSGTTNRITSSGGAAPVIDISASYVGQSSITTLGTITSGVWNGTAIGDSYISSAATWNAKLSNITGLVTAGTNVSITGSGTSGSPYVINATGGGTYTGTANRISIAGSVIDIASTYLGQSSITTLGTIASGTWNATPIGTTKGGVPTGGTAGQILAKINGTDYNTQWIPAPTLELIPGYGILIDGENNISVDPDILTGGGGISDLTGDVYASGAGSVVATIQPNAITTGKIADANVTNAKIASVAWSKITSTPTTVAGYGITDAVTLTGTQTLTNKTLTSPKINLGSDATGDTYYRDSSGNLVRIPVGSNGQVLKVTSGLPAWGTDATGGGGVTDGTYADIAISSTGTVYTITSGAVTNSKVAAGIDAVKLADGSVTNAELQYINSLTSNAQTQLDGKQATLVSGTNIKTINGSSILGSGNLSISSSLADGNYTDWTISSSGTVATINSNAITTSKILDANVTNAKIATGVDAIKLADGSVSNTELQYINSLTSNAQTQIDGKLTNSIATNKIAGRYNSGTGAYEAISMDPTISISGGSISVVDYVTPEQFGAVGNGSTDDSSAIQTAIDTGKIVYLRSHYRVNSTIDLPAGAKVIGTRSTAKVSATTNISVFEVAGSNLVLDNFTIQGNATGSSQHGVYMPDNAFGAVSKRHIVIRNMHFDGLYNGVYGLNNVGDDRTGGFIISNTFIENCTNGLFFDDWCEYNQVFNTKITLCGTGFRIIGGNNNMTGGSISNCDTGVYLGAGSNDSHGMFTGVQLNHNDILIHADGIGYNFLFAGCMMYNGKTGARNEMIIEDSTGVKFIGGDISNSDITITNSVRTEFNSITFLGTSNTLTESSSPTTSWVNCVGVLPADIARYIAFGNTPLAAMMEIRHAGSDAAALTIGDKTTLSNDTGIYFRSTGTAYITTPDGGSLELSTEGIGNGYNLKIDANGIIGVGNNYINFGATLGTSGYGIRANAGAMQYKNSGGSWTDIGSGGGGGSDWTIASGNIYPTGGENLLIDGSPAIITLTSSGLTNMYGTTTGLEIMANVSGGVGGYFAGYSSAGDKPAYRMQGYSGGTSVSEAVFAFEAYKKASTGVTAAIGSSEPLWSIYNGVNYLSSPIFEMTGDGTLKLAKYAGSGSGYLAVDNSGVVSWGAGGGGSSDWTISGTSIFPTGDQDLVVGGVSATAQGMLHVQNTGDMRNAIAIGDPTTIGSDVGIYFRSTGETWLTTSEGGIINLSTAGFGNANNGLIIGATDGYLGVQSGYINYGSTLGSGGYGIRSNSGAMEYKDNAGSWTAFNTLGGGGGGGVSSVGVSGGSTGLTTSGGPITTSGTITLAGTLAAGYGGTGQSSLTQYYTLVGNGTGAVSMIAPSTAGYVYTSNGASSNPSFQPLPGQGQDATYTVLTAITTNTTETAMTGSMPISNGEAGTLEITVYAVNSTNTGSWTRKLIVPYRGTSSTAAVFETHTNLNTGHAEGSGMADCDISYTYNGSGDFIMSVFGTGSTAIQWRAEIKKYSVFWSS